MNLSQEKLGYEVNMNIKSLIKNQSLFHDGCLEKICYNGKTVEIVIISAEIFPEDLNEDIKISFDNRIKGILHLEDIKNITINDIVLHTVLRKTHEDAEILKLEIQKNCVVIMVEWSNFPSVGDDNVFSKINIEAEKIWWEDLA